MPKLQTPAVVFAALYDKMGERVERAGVGDMRRELLGAAEGAVLEIGAGTGTNLEHYPAGLGRLVLTEPDGHMAGRLKNRLATLGRTADVVAAGADALPFPDDSFDTVVVTLVLCTVDDPAAALREIRRVLRPEGRLLFMEHVRSEDPRTARRQDRLRPLQSAFARGCNPNRDTLRSIEASGLKVERVDRRTIRKAPRFLREGIVGVARA
jgi:ubiquinone/menaquinone biosynthesis C-methylase UbiE